VHLSVEQLNLLVGAHSAPSGMFLDGLPQIADGSCCYRQCKHIAIPTAASGNSTSLADILNRRDIAELFIQFLRNLEAIEEVVRSNLATLSYNEIDCLGPPQLGQGSVRNR